MIRLLIIIFTLFAFSARHAMLEATTKDHLAHEMSSLAVLELLSANESLANPFKIYYPKSGEMTNEDYLQIQQLLHQQSMRKFVEEAYPEDPGVFPDGYITVDQFLFRIEMGLKQILIDEENQRYPIKELTKIGKGSNRCLVCFASYNKRYSEFIKSIPEALEKTGFDGYFFSWIGGFPNPTGKEIEFAGVPYANKIFLMLEAQKLGFNQLIAIDSSFYPLNDPAPLFDELEKRDIIFLGESPVTDGYWRYILPETLEVIVKETGVDPLKTPFYTWGGLLGLNLEAENVKGFIKDYYRMVKLGRPFISAFPDQFVLTALLNKPAYGIKFHHIWNMYIDTDMKDSPERLEALKQAGYIFYNRVHH